ncbi:MAG: TetR/AcrR family transcriptional regulator [Rhodoferax sp.]|nr:TetR/AcrR family transcriptional regulator [Rhodoferax sp.]
MKPADSSSVVLLPIQAPGAPGRVLPKGRQTRQAIVDAALALASQIGLEGLSIGALAEVTRMSKSGVFAHFGSREELQISVIREYHARFAEEVFRPALQLPRGLPRVRALFDHWMQRVAVEIQSGCIFISGAVEFDDRPGPVRDALASSVRDWLSTLDRAVLQARQEGHLLESADAQQMAFEIHGLILALHYEARFLKNPASIARAHQGFAHVLERYGRADPSASLAAPSSPSSRTQE